MSGFELTSPPKVVGEALESSDSPEMETSDPDSDGLRGTERNVEDRRLLLL